MKKMLATLLALVMALSCTLALAETAPAPQEPAFKGLTIESEYDVDREALASALTKLGADEVTAKIFDIVASLIGQFGEKAVITNEGFQAEVLMNGKSLVNVVAQVGDAGITLGTSLLPHYALGLSFEEIGGMFLSSLQEQASVMENLDIEGIQAVVTGYLDDFITTCTDAFIPGEAKNGDYVQDGVSYNVMMPMKVDMPTIAGAINELIYNLQNDETIQTALVQLAAMGVEVNLEEMDEDYVLVDPAKLPAVNVEVYMNVNEKGEQSDPTQVSVFVTPAGETEPATVVYTKVNGNNITVDAQLISANTTLLYTMDRDPQDPFGVNCRMDAYVNDLYFGAAGVTSSDDQSIRVDAYLYMIDSEKPVATESGSITMDGALTLGVPEDATVLTLADLSGENAEEIVANLYNELSGSASSVLFTVVSAVPELMSLIMQFQGGADTQQPAA